MRHLIPGTLAVSMLCAACGPETGGREVAKLPPAPVAVHTEPQDAAAQPAPPPADASRAGSLEARRRSTLSPRVGGVVTKVHVRDGDTVKEGAPLVTLDAEEFGLRVRQAEAALAGAKAQLTAAEADWKRTKALAADGATPQAQLDAANARYLGAKAGAAQAAVALAMARKAERDATVRAPYAGVIVRRAISEGEFASVMPPTQLVTLEETGAFDLRIYLPADDVAGVRPGDPATVRVTVLEREMPATVVQVLPPLDTKKGTAMVLLEVPDKDGVLRPGMTAEAHIAQRPMVVPDFAAPASGSLR